jgi:two-component system sensor histidine kinase DesK
VLRPDGPYLWLVYLPFYVLPWAFKAPGTADIVAAVVALPVFLALYIIGSRRTDRRGLPFIAGIVAISFLLGAFFHGNFSTITVYAGAQAGNLRPARLAGRVVALVTGSLVLFGLLLGLPWTAWVMGALLTAMVGAGCIVSARLEDKNRQLEASQEEVRMMAAAAERERIARDLHDLLGHTLTVVAVKSDLAARLVERDPTRAKREMEEMGTIARNALADIRAAVTGMRSAALGAEIAQARRALAAVDVALTYQGPDTPLPPAVEGVLAMLLREGATNVVRHARGSRCAITVTVAEGEVLFTMADDGVGGAIVPGNGLSGMRDRVESLRGRLELDGRTGMTIRARIPIGTGLSGLGVAGVAASAPATQEAVAREVGVRETDGDGVAA